MGAPELFALVAGRYKDKPDDFLLSLGCHVMPDPSSPIGIFNLPEFQACVSITLGEVREWAQQKESR